jgi:hypothetical protein
LDDGTLTVYFLSKEQFDIVYEAQDTMMGLNDADALDGGVRVSSLVEMVEHMHTHNMVLAGETYGISY